MKELAILLKESAKKREDSWNGSSYDLTISEAVKQVCDKNDRARLVDMLLYMCWNDALEWADDVLTTEGYSESMKQEQI